MLDLDAPPDCVSVCSYGDLGSGKTEFAATWPRVVFLSDEVEKGYITIQNMDRKKWYEPDRKPIVLPIKTCEEMQEGLKWIEDTKAKKTDHIQTVVVDSITFYAELYMQRLRKQNAEMDSWEFYRKVKEHLQSILHRLHRLNVHVIWLALQKWDMERKRGEIFVPGAAGELIPAACPYWLYHRIGVDDAGKPRFEIRTRHYQGYPARCRDGGRLPDPLPEPTYRAFAEASGWTTKKE